MQANMVVPMQAQVPTMPQQQPPGGQQQTQAQQQQGDLDPVSRFKALLPRVRESIANLFKESAVIVRQNAVQDSGSQQDIQRSDRERTDRFEKRLEDVFALIDQMEISLKLALELHYQALDSMKNTPQSVMISKPPPDPTSPAAPQPEGQSYAQYLTTMRLQIGFAKEIHDTLMEAATKLMDKSMPPTPALSATGSSVTGGSQQSQQQHTPSSQQD